MNSIVYLTPFLVAFFSTVIGVKLVKRFAPRVSDKRKNSRGVDRHTHHPGVSRFGGIALIVSIGIALFTNSHVVLTNEWWGVIVASVLILVIGLYDDVRELSWKVQLALQGVVASVAFACGVRVLSVTNPWGGVFFFDSVGWMTTVSFALTFLWIVIVMNAVNWTDGVDGLCGGISCIGFVTIFIVSLRPEVNQPPVSILALALSGASLGFLVWNFYPARILAGTSGSWFLGFMLAALSIFSGAKIATTVLVLAVPLLDAVWVIIDRKLSGVSIFSPDRRHLHHRLQAAGWSPRSIAFAFYGMTASAAAVALRSNAEEKAIAFLAIVFLFAIFLARADLIDKVARE
jgi:UDP-GlcNAc:undecaprenyl-phosphate GlcNAc-1-phosphate transferase